MTKQNITILGAGAWGTALAKLVKINGYNVDVWSRSNGANFEELVSKADILVSAVSVAGVRAMIERLQPLVLPPSLTLLTVSKGLDPISQKTPSQVWQEHFPGVSVVVLSGPNLSKEIIRGMPAATVVSSCDHQAAIAVQQAWSTNRFRVYINDDPLGTELGGTLKNVMAIAAGVCGGLNLGANAQASLLTRALPEMIRVGKLLGGQSQTFFGLSGLGDLLATCSSSLSRNYQVGYGLAQGKSIHQILEQLEGTAEGVSTTYVLMDIAQKQSLELPIVQGVYSLLEGKSTPQEALEALMSRELKPEFY
jgi:glycerol-3-phosphate dehydrogenase (NAD(P)+)